MIVERIGTPALFRSERSVVRCRCLDYTTALMEKRQADAQRVRITQRIRYPELVSLKDGTARAVLLRLSYLCVHYWTEEGIALSAALMLQPY